MNMRFMFKCEDPIKGQTKEMSQKIFGQFYLFARSLNACEWYQVAGYPLSEVACSIIMGHWVSVKPLLDTDLMSCFVQNHYMY